ncbi:MAG TPA: fumarylacetoacetate hydrolase family protein, partial [Xanthomonadales bacterium]|nr:fumarylacetoacetate hydrolase family protein [Xanthomonadales bacterium]
GRNFAEHAKEMGATIDKSAPTFFLKPADAVVASGTAIRYPSGTADLHHEVELVVALKSGGRDIAAAAALEHVYGYGVGLDLTRRDLQAKAKQKGMPWDSAKAFDKSAPVSEIVPASRSGHRAQGELVLTVNGEVRQRGDIAEMVHSVPEIIAELSKLFELAAGDLVFCGTPSGVGPLVAGDEFRATFAALAVLEGRITA